jgi:hypothetical protein
MKKIVVIKYPESAKDLVDKITKELELNNIYVISLMSDAYPDVFFQTL